MASNNGGCGALLIGLAVLWAVGQCSDSTSPPAPSYDPPAITRAYTTPPAYDAPPPVYTDQTEPYAADSFGGTEELDSLVEPEELDAYGDEPALSNDNYYTNSRGNRVHSPAYTEDGSVPSGATARCRDGTYSFSQNRRGTCSHHGGVAQWL